MAGPCTNTTDTFTAKFLMTYSHSYQICIIISMNVGRVRILIKLRSIAFQTRHCPAFRSPTAELRKQTYSSHNYDSYDRQNSGNQLPDGLGSCVLVGALFLMGAYGTWRRLLGKTPAFVHEANCRSRSQEFNFVAEAVAAAAPAVVFIERTQQVATFFGEAMAVSAGSGFIVDERGYVLTNAHVVGNALSVKVKLHSGMYVRGHVTEINQVADLALIKLDVPPSDLPLPALKFGTSALLKPGEWVVAMGSPLSLSNTITAGIVSSIHRPSKELGLQNSDMAYVQTDAAITVGNSGGPLVNLDGEVIGVNTMTAGPGISFAIPSDFAKAFVDNANKSAETKVGHRGKYVMGVSLLSITPGLLQSLKMRGSIPNHVQHGVYVVQIWPHSAAEIAGLQRGDVIVKMNGKKVHSSSNLYEEVQRGKKLTLDVVRDQQQISVTVSPEPLDE